MCVYKLNKKTLKRCLIVFLLPTIFTFLIYYSLSINHIFYPNQEITIARETILAQLNPKYQKIKSLSPILELGSDWFKYNVLVENNTKLAILGCDPNYLEIETNLQLESKNGILEIPYGQKVMVDKSITKEDILGSIVGFNFINYPNKLCGPNSEILIQTNPNLKGVLVKVTLVKQYLIFIFLELLIVWFGLMMLYDQMKKYLHHGFRSD